MLFVPVSDEFIGVSTRGYLNCLLQARHSRGIQRQNTANNQVSANGLNALLPTLKSISGITNVEPVTGMFPQPSPISPQSRGRGWIGRVQPVFMQLPQIVELMILLIRGMLILSGAVRAQPSSTRSPI